VAVVVVAATACGPKDGRGSSDPSDASDASGASGASGEPEVTQKVVYEKMPDGSVKKTTITTTRRTVPAPDPPARPADPWPGDPLVKYNVDRINAYRAASHLDPVVYDTKISAFAKTGSERLSKDHTPHANFADHAQGAPGFGTRSAENQGDPGGVPSMDPDATSNGKKQVDIMLKLMMDEGPGGGHYDNMMNPKFRRVGIGLFYTGGRLYMTNDFSN